MTVIDALWKAIQEFGVLQINLTGKQANLTKTQIDVALQESAKLLHDLYRVKSQPYCYADCVYVMPVAVASCKSKQQLQDALQNILTYTLVTQQSPNGLYRTATRLFTLSLTDDLSTYPSTSFEYTVSKHTILITCDNASSK